MFRSTTVALAIALGGLAGCTSIPTATAAPSCEHRGPGHWDAHGGLEDDRWHLAHGQLVTCHGDDEGKPTERHEEAGEPQPRHDEDRDRDEHHHREHKWWRND